MITVSVTATRQWGRRSARGFQEQPPAQAGAGAGRAAPRPAGRTTRAASARSRRASAAGLALVLIVLGVTWLLGGFRRRAAPTAEAAASLHLDAAGSRRRPQPRPTPARRRPGELRSGFETMTITTNLGDIEALIDLTQGALHRGQLQVPRRARSFFDRQHLPPAEHTGRRSLTCGDPKQRRHRRPVLPVRRRGPAGHRAAVGPAADARQPGARRDDRPRTTPRARIVMVNTGANTNGSQFSIVYGDGSDLPAAYSIVGTVTKGLEHRRGVAQAGAVDTDGQGGCRGQAEDRADHPAALPWRHRPRRTDGRRRRRRHRPPHVDRPISAAAS